MPSEKVRTYLREGKIDVNGLEVVTGMLTISKHFKPEYVNSKEWAVASNMKSSVMLDIVQTDQLKHIGIAREVTNRIQRLRKTSGISIDDQIEIFYRFKKETPQGLSFIVSKYSDKVTFQTRMPFLAQAELQGKPVMIGETEFVHPEDEADQVYLSIYLAAPKFTPAFEKAYNQHGATFLDAARSYVAQFDRKTLESKVQKANGCLSFKLNDVDVNLKHREHFFFDDKDRQAK